MNTFKNYRLERHSGEEGLSRLFNDWVDLVAQLGHASPSHFPDWYRAFIRRPDVRGTTVEFIAVYDRTTLAAVFPVGVQRFRRFNLVQLSIPINIDLNSAPDVVVGANQNHRELFKFFMRNAKTISGFNWDVLVVGKTLADSHISKCIESSKRFTTTRRHVGYCCFFSVEGSENETLRLPKKVRSRLRNARNRLKSAGTSEFEIVTDPVSVMETFSAFADLEVTGWKAHVRHGKPDYNAGQAISLNPSKYGFYRDLVEAFADRGYVEMFKLNLNGQPVAVLIAVVLCGNCYLLRTAYDDAHARLSPGSLLLDFVIQHHAEKSDTTTITLFSDHKWQDAWKPLRQDYVSYYCFNSTFAGMTYGAAMRMRGTLVSAYRCLRGED